MVTRGGNRAFRELVGSEEYRRKLREQLKLEDDQPLPPKLAALALELQEELERREQEMGTEPAGETPSGEV
jgi:hypothetical protein